MKIKSLILSLSFLLISCGGPPSENSKTTIMDVVKYFEELILSDSEWAALEGDGWIYPNTVVKENLRICGKIINYQNQPRLYGSYALVTVKMENDMCSGSIFRYTSKDEAIFNLKNQSYFKVRNYDCVLKGHFIFEGFKILKYHSNF